MSNEIELDGNHTRILNSWGYYVIADYDAENRITNQEKLERIKWCREQIGARRYRNHHENLFDRRIGIGTTVVGARSSWCCVSVVNRAGTWPHWVFYFEKEDDAALFKLSWS